MTCAGGRLILFGGWDYSNGEKDSYYNDLHVLDTSSWHWSMPPSPALAPSARAGMQMALVADGSCVVFGASSEYTPANRI
jgi:N-acetylneuraminic acid mutarotase